MKVKIGPYLNYWGPYQLADALLCTGNRVHFDEDQYSWRERWAHKLGDWLSNTPVKDLCEWIHSRRERQIYVHIDNYDVWNMDQTLRLIVGPMFQKLKAVKHGSAMVDDEDVPKDLRSTAPGARDGLEDWEGDHNLHKRYDWLLDEMIWLFTADHDAIEDSHYDWTAVDRGTGVSEQVKQLVVDTRAQQQYRDRKSNAYRLFGKYYETFWD